MCRCLVSLFLPPCGSPCRPCLCARPGGQRGDAAPKNTMPRYYWCALQPCCVATLNAEQACIRLAAAACAVALTVCTPRCSDFCDAYLTHDSVRRRAALATHLRAPRADSLAHAAPPRSRPCGSSTTRASSTRRAGSGLRAARSACCVARSRPNAARSRLRLAPDRRTCATITNSSRRTRWQR
jgi:hypothetical protein